MAILRPGNKKRTRRREKTASVGEFYSRLSKTAGVDIDHLASFPILDPDLITEVDMDGNIHFANPAAMRAMPTLKRLRRKHVWFSDWKKLVLAFQKRRNVSLVRELNLNNRYYRQTISYIREIKRFRIYAIDTTENIVTAKELRRANRILKALSESNQATLHTSDEMEYISGVCRSIVENCGHPIAWIGYTDDAGGIVRPVASAGFKKGRLQKGPVTWAHGPHNTDPARVAIETRNVVLYKDVPTNPALGSLRTDAVKHGYRSVISIPLLHLGRAFGALTILSVRNSVFSSNEISLLTKLSDDLSYGISTIRLRVETEKMEGQKKFLENERVRTEFIADATHELRTPLAIIKGTIDLALLGDDKKIAGARPFLKDIDHEIVHLREILSNLTLLTSKKGSHDRKIVSEDVNIASLVKGVAKRCSSLASKKGISIKIGNIPNVIMFGDESYLEKMLVNLVKNAITYGKDEGRIIIRVRADKHVVRIDITDNGIGIPKEDLPHIFERFYRVDKSRTHGTDEARTGLGLSMAKWVAEAHSGSLTAKSIVGKGSTFTVTLPLTA